MDNYTLNILYWTVEKKTVQSNHLISCTLSLFYVVDVGFIQQGKEEGSLSSYTAANNSKQKEG
jgi:hypothetical protein